jgi:hypothetical protein
VVLNPPVEEELLGVGEEAPAEAGSALRGGGGASRFELSCTVIVWKLVSFIVCLFCIFVVGTVRRKKGKKGEWVPVRKTREMRGKAIPVEQNRSYNIASNKEKNEEEDGTKRSWVVSMCAYSLGLCLHISEQVGAWRRRRAGRGSCLYPVWRYGGMGGRERACISNTNIGNSIERKLG